MFLRNTSSGFLARIAVGLTLHPHSPHRARPRRSHEPPSSPGLLRTKPTVDSRGAPAALPPHWPRVSVVIPAKNEARCLPAVLAELPDGIHEVILVDGHSTDDTTGAALRARPDLRVVLQSRRGKGNALACGIEACTGDVVVLLDADGSADPAEIADFVAALVAGADFAKGTRFLPGGGSADLTRLRRLGNAALAAVMNRLYRTSFTDLCYGYNAFWRHCAEKLALPETEGAEPVFGDGFEIETVIATHVATGRLAVAEVASFERPRFYGSSNLNTWRDGFRVLRAILRERRGAPGHMRPAIILEPFEGGA